VCLTLEILPFALDTVHTYVSIIQNPREALEPKVYSIHSIQVSITGDKCSSRLIIHV
jgi:hypothetical protein